MDTQKKKKDGIDLPTTETMDRIKTAFLVAVLASSSISLVFLPSCKKNFKSNQVERKMSFDFTLPAFFKITRYVFFQCSRWLCSTSLVIFVHEHHNIILENRSEDWNPFSVGYKSNLVLLWSDRMEKCRKKFFSLHTLHTAFLGITCSWKKIIKWNGTTLK